MSTTALSKAGDEVERAELLLKAATRDVAAKTRKHRFMPTLALLAAEQMGDTLGMPFHAALAVPTDHDPATIVGYFTQAADAQAGRD